MARLFFFLPFAIRKDPLKMPLLNTLDKGKKFPGNTLILLQPIALDRESGRKKANLLACDIFCLSTGRNFTANESGGRSCGSFAEFLSGRFPFSIPERQSVKSLLTDFRFWLQIADQTLIAALSYCVFCSKALP